MSNGYHGNILHVDLSTASIEFEHPSESFYKKYGGGSALGLYYVLNNTPPKIDAFDPKNTLVLALSVLTGAPISGLSRMTIVAKSPLTGAIGDSQCGGFFPAEMKFSGFDAVVISGRAENPVYLWLDDGKAKLMPAGHLWGKITADVEETIKSELEDTKIEILQCGIAGEKQVRFSALIHNLNRASGRTGLGAVMGSKNLKAVVVHGSQKPLIADREKLKHLARWGAKNLKSAGVYGLSLLGTASGVKWQNEAGGLPTKNWSSGQFSGNLALDGTTISETILKKHDTCFACVIRCKPVVEIQSGAYKVDPKYGGPEYETLATFGSYCEIDDLPAVAYANQLCNMYGLDTISCGATIAWAMDCFERGIITTKDTDGIDLHFGNAEAMVQMVEKIAKREGFGNILAEGSDRAAAEFGQAAQELVVTVKKQELPAHMPQIKRGLGLIYAVNPFGADHNSCDHDSSYSFYPDRMLQIGLEKPQPENVLNKEKVRFALTTQHLFSCMDSFNVCNFVFGSGWQLYDPNQLVETVNAVTGWDISIHDLLKLGERRLNMLRVFNEREGFNRDHDRLPIKLSQPLKGGKTDGLFIDPKEMEYAKDLYYEMAGWNKETGNPTDAKLKELNLSWLIPS